MDVRYVAAGVAMRDFVRWGRGFSDFGTKDQSFFAVLFERMDGSGEFHFLNHPVEGCGIRTGFLNESRLQVFK